jgi:hypothetical protein
VAAASLAELFSWVNGAWGGVRVARWIELAVLALLVVAMVYLLRAWLKDLRFLLPLRRRLGRSRPPGDRGEGAG